MSAASGLLDPFWLSLGAKMALSAAIVTAASLIVERAGPFVGAMIATLPISAGPAYAYLAAEHGAAFIARSALVSLAVNAGTILFILIYGALARRHGVALSLGSAFALWLVAAWSAVAIEWSFPAALALNAAAFAIAFPLSRRLLTESPVRRPAGRWWDVPARALAVMVLVATVVTTGRVIGPRAAGIAALVPVVLASVALILHPRIGGASTAAVLIHGLPGMVGFTLAVASLHVTAVPLGATLALLIALLVCCLWNAGLMVRQRMQRAT